MTAAEAGRQVCENLTREIEEIAPAGIGHWDPAWEMVAEADAEFMAALFAWEANPTDDGQERVRTAFNAVLEAWREASRQFEGQGAR